MICARFNIPISMAPPAFRTHYEYLLGIGLASCTWYTSNTYIQSTSICFVSHASEVPSARPFRVLVPSRQWFVLVSRYVKGDDVYSKLRTSRPCANNEQLSIKIVMLTYVPG